MKLIFPLLVAVTMGLAVRPAVAAEASPPRSVTLAIYDAGFAMVSESRTINLAGRDERIIVKSLPTQMDPQTASFIPVGASKGFEVLEQRFEDDLTGPDRLFQRFLGKPVQVRTPEGLKAGQLTQAPLWDDPVRSPDPLGILQADGALLTFFQADRVGEVLFPGADRQAVLEPTLALHVSAPEEGLQNIRLNYLTQGLRWQGVYELTLNEEGNSARMGARISVRNSSGVSYVEARTKLVLTEVGLARLEAAQSREFSQPLDPTALSPQRYDYGARTPQSEQAVANLAPVATYELARPLNLDDGAEVYVLYAAVEKLPVSRFYVYDGVRFDRFQRNRRNDWNYGTEYHPTVDMHVEFENASAVGLGSALPPGHINLYQRTSDDLLDLLGREVMQAVPAGGNGHVRLGPARGLRGERERTGYAEVKPLHEYEETFEIRLANDSAQDAVVRVVEHLYRWPDYEIVKADLEYQSTGPQTIEFRPELKAGGRRSIHYTVRYRW